MKKAGLVFLILFTALGLFECKDNSGSKNGNNKPSRTPGYALGDSVYVTAGTRIYGWDSTVVLESEHLSCPQGDSIILNVNYKGMKAIDTAGHVTAYYDSIQLTPDDTSLCSINVTDSSGNKQNYLKIGINRVVISAKLWSKTDTSKHKTATIMPTISSEAKIPSLKKVAISCSINGNEVDFIDLEIYPWRIFKDTIYQLVGTNKNLQNENVTDSLKLYYNQAIAAESVLTVIPITGNWDKNGNGVLDFYYTGDSEKVVGNEVKYLDSIKTNLYYNSVIYAHWYRDVWKVGAGSYQDSVQTGTRVDSTADTVRRIDTLHWTIIPAHDSIIIVGYDTNGFAIIGHDTIPKDSFPWTDTVTDTTGYTHHYIPIYKDTILNRLPKAGDSVIYFEPTSKVYMKFPIYSSVAIGDDRSSDTIETITISDTGWWHDSVPYIRLSKPLGNADKGSTPIVFYYNEAGNSATTETGSTVLMDDPYNFYKTMAHELLHRHAALNDVNDNKNIMNYCDDPDLTHERLLYYHDVRDVETGTNIQTNEYENQWNKIHGVSK